MILRKPYAFLIKHFKFIHIILAILLSYVFYKSMNILTFFNDYINAGQMTIIVGGEAYLFNGLIFAFIGLSVFISIIISALMFNKKKPLLYYFSLIITYVVLLVFLLYTQTQVHVLEQELLDIRIIRMIRDVLVATIILQFIFILIAIIRGVGFDVKKFNFKEDLEELDISEDDREEIEVAVNFDVDSYKTKLKKKMRYLKYSIVENKALILILIVVIIVLVGSMIFYNMMTKGKVYQQGSYINPLYYSLSVKSSYLTQKNYQGNNINNDKYFILLDVQVKKNTTSTKKLDRARMAINIDGYRIYPTYDYIGSFRDIGYEYNDYELTSDYTSYLLVYEIPKQFLAKEMLFEYTDINDKKYNIALDYINLDQLEKTEVLELNKKADLKNTILKDSSLMVSSAEFGDQFRIDYHFCVTDNDCYDYYENIVPDLSSNYNRTLIKIKMDIDINNYYKKLMLGDLINYFGYIYYEIDGTGYRTSMKQVETKKVSTQDLYVSVNSDIKKASVINLEFKIRNYKFIYKLK